MGKKIKITEKQFNMIVESVIKEGYINEEQLDEGIKDFVAGGLMALATLFGGKSMAQTSGVISPSDDDIKIIKLKGYDKDDVSVKYSSGSRIQYRVKNEITGGSIGSQTEKKLEDLLGIVVKDGSKVDNKLTIISGDSEGEGALFNMIKNKYGQDVNVKQKIELVIGKDVLSDNIKVVDDNGNQIK